MAATTVPLPPPPPPPPTKEPLISSPPTSPPTANPIKRLIQYLLHLLLRIGMTNTAQIILFFLGLLWLCCHQYICLSTSEFKMRGTYFSEASLLSESAEFTWTSKHAKDAYDLSEEYRLLFLKKSSNFTERLNFLENTMEWSSPGRIQTYRHVFYSKSVQFDSSATKTKTTMTTMSKENDQNEERGDEKRRRKRRENVYGILEPRVGANRNECIVLVAKHNAREKSLRQGTSGVGLLLSFLQ